MNKSVSLTVTLFAFLLFSPVCLAGTAQVPTNNSVKMSSFSLSTQKSKNRVLLVFAPSETSSAYQQQMQIFAQHKPGFAERDLVLVEVLAEGKSSVNGQPIDEASAAKLRVDAKRLAVRHRFGIGKEDFRVILVGKDGGAKRQDSHPVQTSAIFTEIDAMPMRRQEMRQQNPY